MEEKPYIRTFSVKKVKMKKKKEGAMVLGVCF
jgi:hypothetical protein